jgi:hypothetical protein
MWPSGPIFTMRLPQAREHISANSIGAYGSLELKTTVLGNGNFLKGTGENPTASFGNFGPVGSGTATKRAPFIGRGVFAAQCATIRQARLCATKSISGPAGSSSSSSAATHSEHTGWSQSRCRIRWKPSCDCSQRVCQCFGPEFPMPGRTRNLVFITGGHRGLDRATEVYLERRPNCLKKYVVLQSRPSGHNA